MGDTKHDGLVFNGSGIMVHPCSLVKFNEINKLTKIP